MKLQGEFVVRRIMDDIVAVPVGKTAGEFNGMILLNDVSACLWTALTKGSTVEEMADSLTDQFEVSREEAVSDILEFLDQLRAAQLLEEE